MNNAKNSMVQSGFSIVDEQEHRNDTVNIILVKMHG